MKQKLADFLNDLNTKHVSTKSEFKYSKENIEFLDTLRKDKNGYLQTPLDKKPINLLNYLHSKS